MKKGMLLSTKITIIILTIVLINTTSIGLMSFLIHRDDAMKSAAEKAMAAAKTAAAFIDLDEFRFALNESHKNAHYRHLQKQLDRIKTEENLLHFYAGAFDEKIGMTVYLEALLPGEDFSFNLNGVIPADVFPQEAFDAFNNKKAYVSDIFRLNTDDERGVGAFAPVFNENEIVVGIVGVIKSVEDVLSNNNSFALTMLAVSLLLFAVIVWIPIFFIRRFVVKPLQSLHTATDKIAHGDMDIYIPLNTADDEIGLLSQNFMAMTRKITRQRELLTDAAREARDANKAKSSFLANMSHEIRTPMNAILGIAEIQLREENLSPGAEEAIEKIYESGYLLLSIINDILDLSKIEAGKLELIPVKYDIPSLINDSVQINRMRYDSKPIELSINVDENTPHYLFGDELRIKQVLNNILSNAFKYTDEGKVELFVSHEPIEGSEDIIIIFRIRDTGQGMTDGQIKDLFNEYMRFNAEANRETIGTGLGMSITKHLLNLMNGEISVKSRPGAGSEFIVRLSQKRMGVEVCGADTAEKLRNFNFRSTTLATKSQFIREYMPYGRVLVVDDVQSNIFVAKGMLLPYGLNIDTASSGFEAVKKIEEGNVYDIVFMDHMMPKMDGIETTKKLREMGYTHTIVALTANALIGREEMFLKNGFDRFVSKPIDSRELNLILNELIRNKKPPEVIEAARLEVAQRKKGSPADAAKKAVMDEKLAMAAALDIENALSVLEKLLPDLSGESADLGLFTTTVHGMKSALANIGEMPLSNTAAKLEEAGKNSQTAAITDETPEFLNKLRLLLEKIKNPQTGGSAQAEGEISPDDTAFLQDKLNEIKTASMNFQVNEAKAFLSELKEKKWPGKINDILEKLSLHLLRSEFSKIKSVIDGM